MVEQFPDGPFMACFLADRGFFSFVGHDLIGVFPQLRFPALCLHTSRLLMRRYVSTKYSVELEPVAPILPLGT